MIIDRFYVFLLKTICEIFFVVIAIYSYKFKIINSYQIFSSNYLYGFVKQAFTLFLHFVLWSLIDLVHSIMTYYFHISFYVTTFGTLLFGCVRRCPRGWLSRKMLRFSMSFSHMYSHSNFRAFLSCCHSNTKILCHKIIFIIFLSLYLSTLKILKRLFVPFVSFYGMIVLSPFIFKNVHFVHVHLFEFLWCVRTFIWSYFSCPKFYYVVAPSLFGVDAHACKTHKFLK